MRKHAAEMARLERRSKRDKRAVLDALFVCVCAKPQKPVPPWAQIAFATAVLDVAWAQAASWDAVFGKPWPKGKHLKRQRVRIELSYPVWTEIQRLRAQGWAIGNGLYEEVAENRGIKDWRRVRDIYRRMQRAGWPSVARPSGPKKRK